MTKITSAGAAMTHQDISPRALPKETLQAVSKAQHTAMRRMETTPFILDFLNISSTPLLWYFRNVLFVQPCFFL